MMETFKKNDHIVACYGDSVWQATILKYVDLWCRMNSCSLSDNAKGFTIVAPNGNVNKFYRITGRDKGAVRRVQGMADIQTIWATEAPLFPPELIDEFIRRLANAPLETKKLVMDCNPEGGPEHWFKENWIDRIKDGVIEGTYMDFYETDNPSMTPEKWKVTCDELPDGPDKIRKTQNIWVASAGVVYDLPFYNAIVAQPNKQAQFLDVSIDVADSGVTHALLIGHYGNRYCIIDEWHHDGQVEGRKSPAVQLKMMNNKFTKHGQISRWVSDTNGGMLGTLSDARRAGHITGNVFPAMKGHKAMIHTTQRMIQDGLLVVSVRQKHMIRSAGRTQYCPDAAAPR